MSQLPFTRFHESAVIPSKSHSTDAGFDLTTVEDVQLVDDDTARVRLGVGVELPAGTLGLLVARSSTAFRHGIQIVPGIIDQDYRGELAAVAMSISGTTTIPAGSRIAQLIVLPNAGYGLTPVEVARMTATVRGAGGFGSTNQVAA